MRAAELLTMADELPGVGVNDHRNWSAITVDGKGFCWLNHVDEVAMVKSGHEEQAALIGTAPATYSQGRTTATSAWLVIRLAAADPDEVSELLVEGWRMTAPRQAVAARDSR